MAAAALIHKDVFSARLPDEATIFSAEGEALNLLLSIKRCLNIHILKYFLIHSLHSMNIDHPYILNILYNYYYVSNQGKIVALKFEIVKFKIHSTDINISLNSI